MTQNKTYKQIHKLTIELIGVGLSIEQQFPVQKDRIITFANETNMTAVLKNVPYWEKYIEIEKGNNYNVKLPDGALLQLQYTFNKSGRKISSHRLAYFPSPNLINYEDAPEEHEHIFFANSEFHDINLYKIIKTPLRFDYNEEEKIFKEIEHPYCHLHIGEYENCRIPVQGPITPNIFVSFILRNFYSTAFNENKKKLNFPNSPTFHKTISNSEEKILNVSFFKS